MNGSAERVSVSASHLLLLLLSLHFSLLYGDIKIDTKMAGHCAKSVECLQQQLSSRQRSVRNSRRVVVQAVQLLQHCYYLSTLCTRRVVLLLLLLLPVTYKAIVDPRRAAAAETRTRAMLPSSLPLQQLCTSALYREVQHAIPLEVAVHDGGSGADLVQKVGAQHWLHSLDCTVGELN